MNGLPADRRILHIAAEVAETRNENVPCLLLELKGVLAGYIIGTPEANQIRADLWNYDLTYVTNLALKQDFSGIEGEWHTAAELATIICSACLGYVPENIIEFKKQFLPDVVESLLSIADKIQAVILKVDDASLKQRHLVDLRIVLQSLTKLFENYKFVVLQVISSKKYMQLLMTEEEQTCLIMMILTQNILRADMNCLAELSQSRLHGITDEIVFKMFSTTHVSIASSAIRVLLLCIDLFPPLLDLLSSRRYRGLRAYLKKWRGRGFDDDLMRLIAILETSSAQQMEIVKLNEAAALIQSVFRGHLVRKKLKKTRNAIATFQRIYRDRKKKREADLIKVAEQKDREELEKSKRRNEFLASRTKQLKIIENIPAKTVNRFLKSIESEAASKIQARWRGFKTRKTVSPELANHKRILAAVKIQRQVRKWLAKFRESKTGFRAEFVPHGLTEQRRTELQNLIAKMRDRFPPKAKTFEELKELNEKMFHMLNNHVVGLRSLRRKEQRIGALFAQLSVASDTLLNAPKLHGITHDDVELFSSRSKPVATAARKEHNEALKRLRQPWWKTLGEENDDKDVEMLKEDVKRSGLDEDLGKQF